MRGPWSSLRQEGSTPGVAETDPSVEVTFTGLGEGVNRYFLSVWAQHGSGSGTLVLETLAMYAGGGAMEWLVHGEARRATRTRDALRRPCCAPAASAPPSR